jgi:NADH-ubiquinone oxidoreductase chain 4
MLLSLLIIPIIGSLVLLPIEEGSALNNSRLKKIALTTSLINFFISVLVWVGFDASSSQYQYVQEFNQLSFCDFHIGVDGISLYFVLLTTFITPICILSNWDDVKWGLKYFLISFLILETLQVAVFVVLDLLLFYIFFESVLIPLFFIVGTWGASKARIRASFLLFLYTLAGSLFMLLAILVIYQNVGSTDFKYISLKEISLDSQKILWLAFFLSFAVKTPLFPFHGWLFRAHAEAPLAGSILLAAVILKLATYGYLRVLIDILPDATSYFSPLVQTVALISLVYSSLATLRQVDLKGYIAMSSVAHMAVVVLGLFSNTLQGIEGAILLSLGHGFVSPALFICVGGIIYSRYHTRIIKYYRGMTVFMPVFSILFFCFTIFNTAVPLSLNWLGEFLSLSGLIQRSPLIAVFASSGIVLSAAYSIWLFNRISFASFSPYLKIPSDISRREYMLLLPLLISTVLFGIIPFYFLDNLHYAVSTLLFV